MMPKSKTIFDVGENGSTVKPQSEVYGRCEELEQLRHRLARRRSFLFHGPAGVGKTLLLSKVVSEFTGILYSYENSTPQLLYRNLAGSLLIASHPVLATSCPNGLSSLQTKTSVSVKGLVRDAVHNFGHLVVLDHLQRPSQSLADSVRELMVNCAVPVIAVSRSAHMEDVGFMLPLFPDRSEKFELRNFEAQAAASFASWCAAQQGLDAENLDQFLVKIVHYSDGNPGAIQRMIRMAKMPKCSSGGQIKTAPLYIDFKLAALSQ